MVGANTQDVASAKNQGCYSLLRPHVVPVLVPEDSVASEEGTVEDDAETVATGDTDEDDETTDQRSKRKLRHGRKGFIILEVCVFILSSLLGSKNEWHWLLIVGGVMFVVRIIGICVGKPNNNSHQGWHDFYVCVELVQLTFPILAFTVVMSCYVVRKCTVQSEEITITSWTKSTEWSYISYAVTCPARAVSDYRVAKYTLASLPLLVQVAFPWFVGIFFVEGSPTLGIKVHEKQDKSVLQLAVLNFVDLAAFAVLPFNATANEYFKGNLVVFYAMMTLVCVGNVIAALQVFLASCKQGDHACLSCEEGEEDEEHCFARIAACVSMVVVDLPFGWVRCYLWCIGVKVQEIYIAKNLLCILYEICIIFRVTLIERKIQDGISGLPGMQRVDKVKETVKAEIQVNEKHEA